MRLAERSLKLLSKRRATNVLRTESIGAEALAPAAVTDQYLEDSYTRLYERLARASGGAGRIDDASDKLLSDARRAIDALKSDRGEAKFDSALALATEAVAISNGSRPALRWLGNELFPEDAQDLDMWRADFDEWTSALQAVSPSVGRVDVNGEELGTAWLIQPGYVVTNRHVAQFLSIDPGEERLRFAPHRPAVVDFGDGVTSGGRFDVERIIFSGPDYIDRSRVDHRKLDMAVLKIKPISGAREPKSLSETATPAPRDESSAIVALGFPGTTAGSMLGAVTLTKLFNNQMGVKRVSPGFVDRPIGAIDGDTAGRVFGHDCTTLPGSSGSLVISFDGNGRSGVVGLHYSGFEEVRSKSGVERKGGNFAHAFASMPQVTALVEMAIAEDRGGAARPRPAQPQPQPQPQPGAPHPVVAEKQPEAPVIEQSLDASALTNGVFDMEKAVFFARASEAAYLDGAGARAWALAQGFADFEAFDADNVQGFWCANADVGILAFRGTSNPGQWLRDFKTYPAAHPWGRVHIGFRDGVAVVEPALARFAAVAATRRTVWVTGHSLGGALALLGAARLKMANISPFIYTYGQPRVGLADFAERYALELPERTWRFVNQMDIVTRIPPDPIFRHTGAVKRIVKPGVLEAMMQAEALVPLGAGGPALAEAAFGKSARVFAEAVREAQLPAPRVIDTEPPSLSNLEFAELQIALGAGRPQGEAAPAPEGLFSPFSDHFIAEYVRLLEEIRTGKWLAT